MGKSNMYILDKDFLKQIDEYPHKVKYVKIITLTKDERPIEEAQGIITNSGSINIDGSSIVRRSCSLSFIAQQIDIKNFNWSLNTKCKIYIGLENKINDTYPDIIWFKQGIFVITGFSESISGNNHTVTLTCKDKMVFLNGEIGGHITSLSWDFGKEEFTDSRGNITIKEIPIKEIIRNAVHEFGNEKMDNIIINDLDILGLELLDYRGAEPMYLILNPETHEVEQITLMQDKEVYLLDPSQNYIIMDGEQLNNEEEVIAFLLNKYKEDKNIDIVDDDTIEDFRDGVYNDLGGMKELVKKTAFKVALKNKKTGEILWIYEANTYSTYIHKEPTPISQNIIYNPLISLQLSHEEIVPTRVCLDPYNPQEYEIIKVEYGQTIGYRTTDITYPGDLILSANEPVTNMLDKLVSMLGNFEYFYNIDGKFIFQRKKTYTDITFNNIVDDKDTSYAANARETTPVQYSFIGNSLINSFSNTPNLSGLKNDFSIWGKRTSATGSQIPVHIRYAIDKKPCYYKSFSGDIYYTEEISKDINKWDEEQFAWNKKPNANGLPEPSYNDGEWTPGWWEVSDWAEYHKHLLGEYPQKALMNYIQSLSWINPNDYFPAPDINKADQYKNPDGTVSYNAEEGVWEISNLNPPNAYGIFKESLPLNNNIIRNVGIAIFDVNNIDNTLGYYGHTYSTIGCSHKYYSYFVEKNQENNITAYIYDPKLPYQDEKYNDYYEYIKFKKTSHLVDWREIIYQMAKDYRLNYYTTEDFNVKLEENNGYDENGNLRYPNGITGYEEYYTDMEGFWRQIYCPSFEYRPIVLGKGDYNSADPDTYYARVYNTETNKYIYFDIVGFREPIAALDFDADKQTVTLEDGISYAVGGNEVPYGTIIQCFGVYFCVSKNKQFIYMSRETWKDKAPIKYLGSVKNRYTDENSVTRIDLSNAVIRFKQNVIYYGYDNDEVIYFMVENDKKKAKVVNINEYNPSVEYFIKGGFEYNNKIISWNSDIYTDPSLLNFWFDFLDTNGEMHKYNTGVIGHRTKVTNNDNIKSIYFRDTPTIIAYDPKKQSELDRKSGYVYMQFPSYMESLVTMSTQGKSAMDELDNQLYNYSYCVESISFNAVPVYYLEPNARIFIQDNNTGVNGEYIISKLTIPLQYNGLMSVTATKAADKLY